MSEFHVRVVRIGAIRKHENADSLSIVDVGGPGGYPAIIRTGDFQEGDLAVYVPVGALVPLDDSRWTHLKPPPDPKKPPPESIEIAAKRLRGVFSMGLLTPCEPTWKEGQEVANELRIQRAEPPEPELGNERDPGLLPVYTDLAALRANPGILIEGEEVVLTEKIHGESARYIVGNGRLYCGSRTSWKAPEGGPAGGVDGAPLREHAWWEVGRRLELQKRLERLPGLGIFGEVYGDASGMKYDAASDRRGFRMFDAMWSTKRVYLDHDDFLAVANTLELETVPILYRGPWGDALRTMAEGNSTMAQHVREGFVVKPVHERFDERIGRVILKYHGEGFLTRKPPKAPREASR